MTFSVCCRRAYCCQLAHATVPASPVCVCVSPQSYAKLAYAPPKALLQLLRQQLMPQMVEVEPPQLAGKAGGGGGVRDGAKRRPEAATEAQ